MVRPRHRIVQNRPTLLSICCLPRRDQQHGWPPLRYWRRKCPAHASAASGMPVIPTISPPSRSRRLISGRGFQTTLSMAYAAIEQFNLGEFGQASAPVCAVSGTGFGKNRYASPVFRHLQKSGEFAAIGCSRSVDRARSACPAQITANTADRCHRNNPADVLEASAQILARVIDLVRRDGGRSRGAPETPHCDP